MATLEQYQKHLEKFGDDCLLETAAHDTLEMFELSHLKSLVEFQNRNFIWNGDKWQPKRGAEADSSVDATVLRGMGYTPIRKCANPDCNLDIPAHRPKARYHSNDCAQRAARRRKWARDPNA